MKNISKSFLVGAIMEHLSSNKFSKEHKELLGYLSQALFYDKSLAFRPDEPSKINILLIGAGGTGSWLVPKLIKYFHDCQIKFPKLSFDVVIADNDIVSESNIIRQNFIINDIGKNKASVLSGRYNSICPKNARISYIDKYLASNKLIQEMKLPSDKFAPFPSDHEKSFNLYVNCADNELTRADISANCPFNALIEPGTDKFNGQVLWLNNSFYSPHYSELIDIDTFDYVKIEDCSTADVSLEAVDSGQMFNSNDMAATIIGNMINCMIREKIDKDYRYRFLSGPKLIKSNFVTGHGLDVSSSVLNTTYLVTHRNTGSLTYDNNELYGLAVLFYKLVLNENVVVDNFKDFEFTFKYGGQSLHVDSVIKFVEEYKGKLFDRSTIADNRYQYVLDQHLLTKLAA